MSIEIRHVRVFLAIADHLNLTRAAGTLHTTQPAVSRTLKQLEEHLGHPLVSRSTHHVSLTAEGEAFREHAAKVLADFDGLIIPASLPKAPRRIGHAWSALGAFASPLLQHWRSRQPTIAIELSRFDDRFAGLRDRRADIGILRSTVAVPGFRVEPLFREQRLAALSAGHRLAQRRSVTLAELAVVPVVINTVSGTTKLAL